MNPVPFRVIPVIDLKAGRAVHAVGGRRDHYQPLASVLHAEPDVLSLACAIRDTLGLRSLYLADLDAIQGAPCDLTIHQQLLALGIELWVDAGLRNVATAGRSLAMENASYIHIAGLETLDEPGELAAIMRLASPERVILSLDLFQGKPRIAHVDRWWSPTDPTLLARQAIDLGIQRMIVLDIARVGTSQGAGTAELVTEIHNANPHVDLIVGGGIAGLAEIVEWKDRGVSGVLIGSALHDGRITAADIARLSL